MRILITVMAGICWAGAAVAAGPQGDYAELHSCEVYTGGCTASAWSSSAGRCTVRVWKIEAGEANGIDLAGLPVVVLEIGKENLAMRGVTAMAAVAYLPEEASSEQRQELEKWLKGEGVVVTKARVVPISYARDGADITVRAGREISFATRAIGHCETGSCDESLWYEPRGKVGAYTVLMNDESVVDEPDLKISWKDHSSKSVFFGHFGVREAAVFSLASVP